MERVNEAQTHLLNSMSRIRHVSNTDTHMTCIGRVLTFFFFFFFFLSFFFFFFSPWRDPSACSLNFKLY